MKSFSRERIKAIRLILEKQDQDFEVVDIKGVWWLRGRITEKLYISENGVEDFAKDNNRSNNFVTQAIKDTEPKVEEKDMDTSTVIDTTKKDATDIAKAVAKRIAAEKLLTAVGIPLGSMLKKAGLDPEIAKSPFAPAIVAVIGLLAANSIQELPKKQLVHELCSLYLEQSAVNLLSPVLGDLVTMFTQAVEGIE
jgi:hypothetical protein